jgi:hypothetical protein
MFEEEIVAFEKGRSPYAPALRLQPLAQIIQRFKQV